MNASQMTTHSRRWLSIGLLAVSSFLFPVDASANRSETMSLYDPLIDSATAAAYQETAGLLSTYFVDATFNSAGDTAATITGSLDLEYVNSTRGVMTELYFRLYANALEYGSGGISMDSVSTGATAITPEVVDELATTIRVPLLAPVQPGGDVGLAITFTTVIPTNPAHSYGMFAHEDITDTYALAHWLPLLAGYDDGRGWNLESTSTYGDPVFTNSALFDVTLTHPAELTFATTGSEINRTESNDRATTNFRTGPVRDFVMAASPNWQHDSVTVGESSVRSFFLEDDVSAGLEALLIAEDSIELFSNLFGGYPYEEFDIVEMDLIIAAGIEFPGIIFISDSFYDDFQRERSFGIALGSLIAHEVAHQWWYGIVGNDQYLHAFLDEGMSNYAATLYYEFLISEESAQEQVDVTLRLPYMASLYGDVGDMIVDQPTASFASAQAYDVGVYSKAGLGFQALRQELGDELFFDAIRAYVAEYRFEVATPADMFTMFESVSGRDLDQIWQHWFNAMEGTSDFSEQDFELLLDQYVR